MKKTSKNIKTNNKRKPIKIIQDSESSSDDELNMDDFVKIK